MSDDFFPFLDIFLGILGVGLSILFCTSFCRACHRYREAQMEREAWRRTAHDGQPPSIYFIPFPGNLSLRDAEDPSRDPRYSQDHPPPQYSTVSCGPPAFLQRAGIQTRGSPSRLHGRRPRGAAHHTPASHPRVNAPRGNGLQRRRVYRRERQKEPLKRVR